MHRVRIFGRKTTTTRGPLPLADAPLGELIQAECRGRGLSPAELATAQEEAEAAFPLDLCELLSETLPSGDGFPDWRHRPGEEMGAWRERLIADFYFDVVNNGFWHSDWGVRPDDPNDTRDVIEDQLARVPVLIPIYIHRAIPNEPLKPGNPVFSVWQAVDMIIYGGDLRRYLLHEFHEVPDAAGPDRPIRFWTDMLDAYVDGAAWFNQDHQLPE
jgi:hypothetical protein